MNVYAFFLEVIANVIWSTNKERIMRRFSANGPIIESRSLSNIIALKSKIIRNDSRKICEGEYWFELHFNK